MFFAATIIGASFIWFYFGWLVALVFGLAIHSALSFLNCSVFRGNFSTAGWFLGCCLLAYTLLSLESEIAHKLPRDFQHKSVQLEVCFEQTVRQPTDDYAQVVARVVKQPDSLSLRKVRLAAYNGEFAPLLDQAGLCLSTKVRLRQPFGRIIPGGFNADGYYLVNKIDALATIQTIDSVWFQPSISAQLYQRTAKFLTEQQARAVWSALVLGWSSSFPEQVKQTLIANQLMHLFVISGMHFSFIALVVGTVVHLFARLISSVYIVSVNEQILASALCLFGYLIFLGFPIPAVRAFSMLLLPLLVLRLELKLSFWRILALTLIGMSCVQPSAWLSASAWLSVVSVSIIILLFKWQLVNQRQPVQAVLIIQGAMFLLSFFWSIIYGFKINILSVFLVILLTPCVLFLLMPLSILLTAFSFPAVSEFYQWLVDVLFKLLDLFVDRAFILPWFPIELCLLLAALLLVALKLRNIWSGLSIGLIGVLMFLPYKSFNNSELWVYDVGHGQALLLVTPKGNFLLDTGGQFNDSSTIFENSLLRILPNLDGAIISHKDTDHSAGILALRSTYPNIPIWSGQKSELPNSESLINCHQAGVVNEYIGFVSVPVGLRTTSNNHSCIVEFNLSGKHVLLTSDADKFVEYYLMQHQAERLPADLILLGHHGSDSSSSAQWLNLHQQSLILVSNSNRSSPTWPSLRIWQWLKNNQIGLWQTSQSGTLRIRVKNDKFRLKTWDSAYRKRLQH